MTPWPRVLPSLVRCAERRQPEVMALVAGHALAVITDDISCRLVDGTALLRCRSCDGEDAAATLPRPAFLAAVREFIHQHRGCRVTYRIR